MKAIHTLETTPWEHAAFLERLAISMTMMLMYPLTSDQRITALMSLLVHEMREAVIEDEEIDVMLGIMRRQLCDEPATNRNAHHH
jgi:hypothetical protein